ncbi:hypothetical protein BDR05DRAFT_978272 [Suillus weaverae]|nr:hypothetical protein BDR05DRAFT_978272 [Suillus weaverae]
MSSSTETILELLKSAKETYGVGLLVFHMYCYLNCIEEEKCCPVSSNLLLKFLSSCTGAYLGSVIANFTASIKAWHLLHGRLWLVRPDKLKTMLGGATVLAPSTSKCPKRQPFTLKFISAICNHLDLNKPLNAAVLTCIMMTFYCIARLGEFTVRTVKSFDLKKHISRAGKVESTDHNSLPVTNFMLPSTKTSQVAGERPEDHLFVWKHEKGLWPLSKSEFMKRMLLTTTVAGLLDFKGILEYLLHRVPFDIIKTMERWLSEDFILYL